MFNVPSQHHRQVKYHHYLGMNHTVRPSMMNKNNCFVFDSLSNNMNSLDSHLTYKKVKNAEKDKVVVVVVTRTESSRSSTPMRRTSSRGHRLVQGIYNFLNV